MLVSPRVALFVTGAVHLRTFEASLLAPVAADDTGHTLWVKGEEVTHGVSHGRTFKENSKTAQAFFRCSVPAVIKH